MFKTKNYKSFWYEKMILLLILNLLKEILKIILIPNYLKNLILIFLIYKKFFYILKYLILD